MAKDLSNETTEELLEFLLCGIDSPKRNELRRRFKKQREALERISRVPGTLDSVAESMRTVAMAGLSYE